MFPSRVFPALEIVQLSDGGGGTKLLGLHLCDSCISSRSWLDRLEVASPSFRLFSVSTTRRHIFIRWSYGNPIKWVWQVSQNGKSPPSMAQQHKLQIPFIDPSEEISSRIVSLHCTVCAEMVSPLGCLRFGVASFLRAPHLIPPPPIRDARGAVALEET